MHSQLSKSSSMQVQQIASAQRTAPVMAQPATQHGLKNGLLGSKLHVRQSCTAARFAGATDGDLRSQVSGMHVVPWY